MGANMCCHSSAAAAAEAADAAAAAAAVAAPVAPPASAATAPHPAPATAVARLAHSAMQQLQAAQRRARERARRFAPRFEGDNQDVAIYLTRSCNANVLVYQARWANPATRAELHHTSPIEVYWLSVDPAYRARRVRRGITSDRVELNMIERRAFGVTLTPLAPDPINGRVWAIQINVAGALTRRVLRLYRDALTGFPVVETEMGSMMQTCRVTHLHAYVVKAYTGWRVLAMDMHGTMSASGGKNVSERVKGPGDPGDDPAGGMSDAESCSPLPSSAAGTPGSPNLTPAHGSPRHGAPDAAPLDVQRLRARLPDSESNREETEAIPFGLAPTRDAD
eukprot:TRINITY_DN2350_c1_g1_i1.p2 TRINITY_DN2350_c1_g1~~TRINITY_DN2350_c1_g1_i1.p2  ORF type:complete len:363 (+),score=80.37 TRINITY_DN2350_c1_g1_i1:83-1090(+)